MTFQEALTLLGISEHGRRIWDSNSRGELAHTQDYIDIAEWCLDEESRYFTVRLEFFQWFFTNQVEHAEKTWQRPESVFQHIKPMMYEYLIKENDGTQAPPQ